MYIPRATQDKIMSKVIAVVDDSGGAPAPARPATQDDAVQFRAVWDGLVGAPILQLYNNGVNAHHKHGWGKARHLLPGVAKLLPALQTGVEANEALRAFRFPDGMSLLDLFVVKRTEEDANVEASFIKRKAELTEGREREKNFRLKHIMVRQPDGSLVLKKREAREETEPFIQHQKDEGGDAEDQSYTGAFVSYVRRTLGRE